MCSCSHSQGWEKACSTAQRPPSGHSPRPALIDKVIKETKRGGGMLLCLQGYLSMIQYIRVPWVGGCGGGGVRGDGLRKAKCRRERADVYTDADEMALSSWLRHRSGHTNVLLSNLNSKEKMSACFWWLLCDLCLQLKRLLCDLFSRQGGWWIRLSVLSTQTQVIVLFPKANLCNWHHVMQCSYIQKHILSPG